MTEVLALARGAVSRLRSRIPITEAYLFGSQVTGAADEESDIDIAAFSPAVDGMRYEEKVALIVEIERGIDARIDLHVFGESRLAEARPSNLFGYVRTHGLNLI